MNSSSILEDVISIVKSIDHQLIVAVDGSLGEAEEQSLGNVVLSVEI